MWVGFPDESRHFSSFFNCFFRPLTLDFVLFFLFYTQILQHKSRELCLVLRQESSPKLLSKAAPTECLQVCILNKTSCGSNASRLETIPLRLEAIALVAPTL